MSIDMYIYLDDMIETFAFGDGWCSILSSSDENCDVLVAIHVILLFVMVFVMFHTTLLRRLYK